MVSILVGRLTISVNRTSGAPTQQVHLQEIYQQLFGLVNIFVVPLMSIVSALLYLKMRQLGGETLNAALAQTEEMDAMRFSATALSAERPVDRSTTPRLAHLLSDQLT